MPHFSSGNGLFAFTLGRSYIAAEDVEIRRASVRSFLPTFRRKKTRVFNEHRSTTCLLTIRRLSVVAISRRGVGSAEACVCVRA